jgi:hypothetical protein
LSLIYKQLRISFRLFDVIDTVRTISSSASSVPGNKGVVSDLLFQKSMTEVPKRGNQPLVATLLALLALLSGVNEVVAVVVLLNDLVTERGVQTRVRSLLRRSTEANRDCLDSCTNDTWKKQDVRIGTLDSATAGLTWVCLYGAGTAS